MYVPKKKNIEGQKKIVKNDDVDMPLVFEIRSIHYHLLFCRFSLSSFIYRFSLYGNIRYQQRQ